VYPITGAFFFGAASAIGSVLDGIADSHQVLVIDVGGMPFLDSSAANTISRIARKARKRGVAVFATCGFSHGPPRAADPRRPTAVRQILRDYRAGDRRYRKRSQKIPVGTDSLSQQPAEKPSVGSDPARAGPTPE
jgi:MFS superfamily sulfate permease-like transporter